MFKTIQLAMVGLLCTGSASGVPTRISSSLIVDGVNLSRLFGFPTVQAGRNEYSLAGPVTVAGVLTVGALSFSTFDDPFINYTFGVTNLSNATQTYNLSIPSPYLGGPYTILRDSFSDAFTDGDGNGIVTIGLAPGATSIGQPVVDGVNRDGQGAPCTRSGPGGFAASCNPGPSLTIFPIPATAAAGAFSVNVAFTLSPGDVYSLTGRVELANVPEPSTFMLLAMGLGCVGYFGWRRVGTDRSEG